LIKLQHRLDIRIALIAAVALLIAQTGAMAHAYSHVPALQSTSQHQSGQDSHDLCSDCLAFAPLLSAAGTPAALLAVQPQGQCPTEQATVDLPIGRSLNLAFRSRAPPADR
jgi:hypothetical protein